MRLPYVPEPPPTTTPEEADILARVQARRTPGGLIPLDRALLHSFPVADGWNSFIGAIRTKTSLTTIIKELIICRVAVLNGAWFEWEHHAPLLQEGGFSEDGMLVVRDARANIAQKVEEKVLSPAEGAVLKYTDAMTQTVAVPDLVFQDLKNFFNEKEIVEITATSAAYNCVSRFLVALDVGERNIQD
ncbi:carboxymuconolactone decarboxylase family protein [Aspergillus clavatus NRRL 1]|uniref:4-carboxymuconolactone decarboxylase, putative n=1 Tax=Aspergillus clavatus (strain ATCC 1007 / CBS 513.65 / DSM 816 / NCTC 3887 / NRRL 1 / QM 1276 / 107) TaxID=344612 RepID=A1CRT8_ASPCL|nr:4-carboxymuconolactone decarboxylase, putative [Aspergillus clavatus NRRL 1]EAW08359.1 4-carboxymuconolactone decarboxylase, putative [Aspergillus clavatus NRRL 1]